MTRTLPPLEAPRLPARAEIVDTTLPNGLRVVAAYAPSVPMVDLRLRVPVAGHPAYAPALHVAAEAMFQGSDGPAQAALGEVGASLYAGLDPAWFTAAGSAMADGITVLLDKLVTALTAPRYHSRRCEAAARRVLARLAVTRAQPHVFTQQVFRDRFLPAGTPPVVPDDAAVRRVTAESVTAAHHEVLRPTGAFLVVTGAVDPERVVTQVATAVERWQPGAATHRGEPPRAEPRRTGVALAARPAAVQSQILLAAPVPPRADPRFAALNLTACVFGGYFSSRLVTQVRGRSGLAYRAAAVVDELFGETLLAVNVDTASEFTAAALAEVEQQLLRLADEPPTPRELDMAKSFCCGMFALQLSSQAGLASELTSALSFGFDPGWLWEFTEALLAVDQEAAGEAAATWFAPARFAGVVTGNVAALTDRRFGGTPMT